MSNIKEKECAIAEIIPVAKLPTMSTQVFSYKIPNKLKNRIKIGNLVKIPFRRKKIIGLVYKINRGQNGFNKYKLKNIESLLDNRLSFSKEQIRLSEHISKYYYTSISSTIKAMIPSPTKNYPKKNVELNNLCEIPEIDEKTTAKTLLEIKSGNEILLIHNLNSSRHNLYLQIIKNETSKEEQTLIVFPEYFDIYNFASFYLREIGEKNVAILTSWLSKSKYFEQWLKTQNKETKIILGTKKAVFAKFNNLKLIIVDDEHSKSHKQWDQNPRYNSIDAAEKLSEIWKAKIILSSPSPSVESYYKTKKYKGKFCKVEIFANKVCASKNFLTVFAKSKNSKKDYSIFSEKVKKSILKTVHKKHQVIIFIPRLGKNTIVQCKDCEYTANCKNCGRFLARSKIELYCSSCKEKFPAPEICPKCGGNRLNFFGCGTERIEEEINKILKWKNIKIVRADSNVLQNKRKQFKIYKDFINGKIDILIGAKMALKNWNVKKLSLLIIMFPEIIFNQPSFNSKENIMQIIFSARTILKNKKSKIIIQSGKTKSETFKFIKNQKLSKFYLKELEDRKQMSNIGYPPFSNLIKLTFRNISQKRCEEEALKLHGIIKNKISSCKNLKKLFEVADPFAASNYKEHGKWRWNIIIKSKCREIEIRNSLLSCVKNNWIIDIDPIDIM